VARAVLNIAHRGASGRAPENTLAAFRAAIEYGARMCELDVRATRDGEIVVIHDDTVDRTTDGSGAVKALTMAELRQLDAGVNFGGAFTGERIPTLGEVFAQVGNRCALNIELKAAGIERRVCEIIAQYHATPTALVSSFDWDAIAIVRHLEPRIRIGLLATQWPARLLGAAFELRAEAINPQCEMVTEDLCIAAHQRNLNVYPWVANEIEELQRLIAIGVDGIMTNYPERLRALADLS
jgi:glycerophosphoryl diester phosphodiesterase